MSDFEYLKKANQPISGLADKIAQDARIAGNRLSQFIDSSARQAVHTAGKIRTTTGKLVEQTKEEFSDYIPPLQLQEAVISSLEKVPYVSDGVKYKQALPGFKFDFPRDHAAHDDYKTEWWYYVGHLQDEKGHDYGYQLTFFRHKLYGQNFYSAHFAVTDSDAKNFYFKERQNVLHPGSAGASSKNYVVWNGNWSAREIKGSHLLVAGTPEFAIKLNLNQLSQPVENGTDGISKKGSGTGLATHYYSLTNMPTEGYLVKNGTSHRVKGSSWMDHEFGSNMMSKDIAGWNWYSMQLDNGMQIMLYHLRNNDGTLDKNSSGTLVLPDGTKKHLELSDFAVRPTGQWQSKKTTAVYPMGWELELPAEGIKIAVEPVMKDQELQTERSVGLAYWEGNCKITGNVGGKTVEGRGYVEMTGYERPFSQLPKELKP